jgi:hypothetical protein
MSVRSGRRLFKIRHELPDLIVQMITQQKRELTREHGVGDDRAQELFEAGARAPAGATNEVVGTRGLRKCSSTTGGHKPQAGHELVQHVGWVG